MAQALRSSKANTKRAKRSTAASELPDRFSEPARAWFEQSFPSATRIQREGWPKLIEGGHTLLVAPTGSGKTLAAFLWAIDQCTRLEPDAEKGVRVLYVSPLKALVYDIERNLRAPLIGIQRTAERLGARARDVRVDMRTGDTPARDRRRQLKDPADILVTTPESLFLLLGSQAAATLATVHTVIVDEIHVFAATKRGVHLALSLERLHELVEDRATEPRLAASEPELTASELEPEIAGTQTEGHIETDLKSAKSVGRAPQRVGLSATVRPTGEVAHFLGGVDRHVNVVDASEPAHIELRVVVPVPDMDNVAPISSERIGVGPEGETEGAETPEGGPILADLQSPDLEAPDLQTLDEQAVIAADQTAENAQESTGGKAGGWPRGAETSGVWPAIYPQLLALIHEHRSTILFTNSRGLCERLAQRLNDLHDKEVSRHADPEDNSELPELVRAHHGSISHEQRREIEESLKAGRLRCIVATSSLELGIDMGAVDLVILVESPGSVARGLQRVGRAGHGVGELSEGVIFPKFKGDLLECAVVSRRMLEGTLEPLRVQQNPLDVLAQQIVAMVCNRERTPDELEALVRRAHPYRELSTEALRAVLDMLSGRFPSDEFADIRPRLVWDRAKDVLSARRGAKQISLLNAGTIPDRGLYSVHLGVDGPRLGELDEEMVYESRAGDVILLGASAWRVTDITRDRVVVVPAPGEPGRMPFWHGDGPGRPIELGRAIGDFLHQASARSSDELREWLAEKTPLNPLAVENLVGYIAEQQEATGLLPSDRTLVIERFRDELGDWRVCLLTPFGSRVHAPWAMALQRTLTERSGFDVETMYTDDGVVLRFPDTEELPQVDHFLPAPEEVEDLVVDQVGSSALFATRFRENAARALLTPKRRGGERTPLWLQRLRAKTLLAAVQRFANFPIVLETYRECLRDVFDLPALIEILGQIQSRKIRVHEVETDSASPFARSLVYAYIAQYLYEQDAPMAERKAQALTLDRNLLRELVGQAELRELLDPEALSEVEAELQCLADDRQARDLDELHDLLRRLGDLTETEIALRCREDPESWLRKLAEQQRAGRVQIDGEARWISAEDAARYRDALGVQPPRALPQALLESSDSPLESLLSRYARCHGPFTTTAAASRFGLRDAQVQPLLKAALERNALMRGEIRPGGAEREWCDIAVLRRIKRRTLARLRGEVAPVDASVLGRFLPRWQGLELLSQPSNRRSGNRASRREGSGRSQPGSRSRRPQLTEARTSAQLEEAVSQLEGLPLPWSVFSSAVLPARVQGFQPEMLDMLAASGELVWIGHGAIRGSDGRVALYRRDQAAVLLRKLPSDLSDERIEIEEIADLHHQILDHLEQRGASFTTDLQRLPAARDGRLAELEATIWDLVWAGLVTNDTFLPLRGITGGRRSSRTGTRQPARTRPRFRPAAQHVGHPPARRSRGRGGRLSGGRWSLVRDLAEDTTGDAVTDTEWAHRIVTNLLERYGVVAREVALAEEIPGGFETIYPVLRSLEDAGHVRRGYFVEGLSGRQFALAGAVERLRAERSELDTTTKANEDMSVLPAVDPANPYGALLPWPQRRLVDGPKPRRVPGAWIILRGGSPLVFLESGKRSLVCFPGIEREGGFDAARTALLEIVKAERKRSLRIARIDGEPATDSELFPRFESAGFVRSESAMRLEV